MKAEQMQALRERLARRQDEVERALQATEDALKPVKLDQTSVGRLSRMDALQQQATRTGLREALLRERRRIEAALGRIEDGRYGRCCACEGEMPVERLQADPAAPFCIDCEIERGERKHSK